MSSRNDTYLSLCLAQASLSPLHYRHGCIIVRGGKVIGKGYNDYRSGFNGGAQSTGQLSNAGPVGYSPKPKNPKKYHGNLPNSKKLPKTYVAFESQNHAAGTGGGALANTPLSMHSEMMAINSALSLSSAIACQGTARSTQCTSKHTPTPSVEMPRSRLRLQSAVAGLTFKSLVLKPLHLDSMQPYQEDYYNVEEEEEKTSALKRQNTGSNNVHHHAQINYLEFQKANSQKARQLTSDDNEKQRKQYLYGIPDVNQYGHSRHKKTQTVTHLQQQHRSSAIVVPQNRILTKSHQVAARTKDSRLKGADLYVARLGKTGRANLYDCGCRRDGSTVTDEAKTIEESNEPSSIGPGPSIDTKPLTGSLHDELRFPSLSKEERLAPKAVPSGQQVTATYSRPCYRCVSYMHSAGIKRVFWTNNKGGWEGGKVRELVDALEGPMSPDGDGSTAAGAGSVYVTKSEVLLLKGLR